MANKSTNPIVTEFSMYVSKAPMRDGAMRVHMTVSDTEKDSYGQEMSLELFNNFIRRSKEPLPDAFQQMACDEGWCGGKPYLSIAHYKTGNGKNIPGMVDEMYVDGNRFKSNGTLEDTPLGQAVYKSLKADLEGKSQFQDKVRVSIGFIDLKHSHGNMVFERKDLTSVCSLCDNGMVDGKKYLDGYLVHDAFTRVPVNTRTSAEIMQMSEADEIKTKHDDAASIIGDEVDMLVEDSIAANSAMVVKSDEPVIEEARKDVTPADKKAAVAKYGDVTYADPADKKYPIDTAEHIRAAWSYINMPRNSAKYSAAQVSSIKSKIVAAWKSKIDKNGPPSAHTMKSKVEATMPDEVITPEVQADELEVAYTDLRAGISNMKALSLPGDEALRLLQPKFDALANVVRSQFPANAVSQKPADTLSAEAVAGIVKSTLAELLPNIVSAAVAEVSKSKPAAETNKEAVVQPRSIQPKVDVSKMSQADAPKKASQFAVIARLSTGIKNPNY